MNANVLARFRVKDYRGIQFIDTAATFPKGIPATGMLIKGPNGQGKTSILNALLAGLAGQDIGADAIRLDDDTHPDRAEILIDMGAISVERSITPSGSRLVVKENDKAIPSPSKWLASVLGTTLDPLAFAAEKPKDRKRYILSAMPVEISREQIAEWIGKDGPKLSDDLALDLTLHGLEVVDQVRKDFEAQRKTKNADLKTLEKDETALIQGAPPAVPDAPSVEAADRAASARASELGEMTARAARVTAQVEKTQATRERATLIAQEAERLAAIPSVPSEEIEAAAAACETAKSAYGARVDAVHALEDEIAKLQARLTEAQTAADVAYDEQADRERDAAALTSKQEAIAREHEKATVLRRQATELEAAIVATSEIAPTDIEIANAEIALTAAQTDQTNARAAQHRRDHEAKIAAIAERRAAVGVEASQLDAMVQKFGRDVPNELITKANGIEGLTVDGDEVLLDGVKFSKLSGREQILFAVRLAKRLNHPRAKILITDGLEKIDDDSLPEFLAEATSDGFQLIATRVSAGGIEFEAIGAAEEGS